MQPVASAAAIVAIALATWHCEYLSFLFLFNGQVRDLQKAFSDSVLNLFLEQYQGEFNLFESKYYDSVSGGMFGAIITNYCYQFEVMVVVSLLLFFPLALPSVGEGNARVSKCSNANAE